MDNFFRLMMCVFMFVVVIILDQLWVEVKRYNDHQTWAVQAETTGDE